MNATVSLGLDDAHKPAVERRIQLYTDPQEASLIRCELEYRVAGGIDAAEWRRPTAEEWELEIAHGAPVGTLRKAVKARGLVFVRFGAVPGTIFFRTT